MRPIAPKKTHWNEAHESVRFLIILMFERLMNEELLDRGSKLVAAKGTEKKAG